MRKLVLLEHVSLDGFLAGPDGDMQWIRVDDELWQYITPVIDRADTAIYGRVTYELMQAYWPTAGSNPGASQHDIHHSHWANRATKLVFSTSLDAAPWGASEPATLVKQDVVDALRARKRESGADMLMLGSASLARACIRHGLIDDFWINVNPVILGAGTPLFPHLDTPHTLRLVGSRGLASGVVGLHYEAPAG